MRNHCFVMNNYISPPDVTKNSNFCEEDLRRAIDACNAQANKLYFGGQTTDISRLSFGMVPVSLYFVMRVAPFALPPAHHRN